MKKIKAYVGSRGPVTGEVVVLCGVTEVGSGMVTECLPLSPRLDVVNHSPDGFEWGYGGSGPSQLAFAILADLIGVSKAVAFYQSFKSAWVAKIDRENPWVLNQDQAMDILRGLDGWIE